MNDLTRWLDTPAAAPHEAMRQAAAARQAALTKPPGALGKLEEAAIRLAALQGTQRPCVDKVSVVVFAGDHGVANEQVSAFPQSVTVEMIKNFAHGGAAISVLARELGARLEVINLGTVDDPGQICGVLHLPLGPGTANIRHGPAMQKLQLAHAMHAGKQAVERARLAGAHLYIGGEMGIGNTTSATALACALLEFPADRLTGPGTGLTTDGIMHKTEIIRQALVHNGPLHTNPLEALRRLGGFEIAALTGSYLASAQSGLPVLIDGFISSVAALVATRLCPGAGNWFLYSHSSVEPGHRDVLATHDAEPMLDLRMRLGEGSGAATALPLLRLACALHNHMATFAEAEVSESAQ